VIWKIIENYYKNQIIKLPKILHYCDAGVASWYDIAMHIKDICLKLDFIKRDKYILPIPSYKYPTLAKRPKFSVLDSSFTNELLDLPYKHWRCATSDFMESLTAK
jgi:dTDP-4-dehydrorhamnose reductase